MSHLGTDGSLSCRLPSPSAPSGETPGSLLLQRQPNWHCQAADVGCSCLLGAWRWWSGRPSSAESEPRKSPLRQEGAAQPVPESTAADAPPPETTGNPTTGSSGTGLTEQHQGAAAASPQPRSQTPSSAGSEQRQSTVQPSEESGPQHKESEPARAAEASSSSLQPGEAGQVAAAKHEQPQLAKPSPSQAGGKRRTTEPGEDPGPDVESNKRARAAPEKAGEGKPCEPTHSVGRWCR